jgi:hypothetical protein
MISTGTFRHVVIPLVYEEIKGEVQRQIENGQWRQLVGEATSDKQYVETRQEEAMGPAQFVTEGRVPYPDVTPVDGYSKRITQHKVAARLTFTKELRKFARTDIISRYTRNFSKCPNQVIEIVVAALFEYCDTTSGIPTAAGLPMVDTVAADGQTFAYTAHTYKSDSSRTYSNLGTSASLTQTVLQNAVNTVLGWKDAAGSPIAMDMYRLIVGIHANRYKAYELLKSEKQSETNNNAANALREDFGTADYWCYKWMVTAGDWFLKLSRNPNVKLRWGWKWEQKAIPEESGVSAIEGDLSFSLGVDDPRDYYANKV